MTVRARLMVMIIAVLLGLRIPAQGAERGILLTDEVQLKVADAFMEEGEYYRAITEYKRLLILFPDSEKADYALFRIGMAYYKGEEYEPSARSFSSLRERHPLSGYVPKCYYFEGLSYWKTKKFDGAKKAFEALAEGHPESEYAPAAIVANSLVALDEENISGSVEGLKRFVDRYPEHPGSQSAQEVILRLQEYQDLPQKSPVLAGIMSALIPGSGYLYAGRYGDGVTAFLVNALFIAGTIVGLHQENYAVAALAGGIGLPFYFGSIYGSANAAKKWNIAAKSEFRNRVYLTLDFIFPGEK